MPGRKKKEDPFVVKPEKPRYRKLRSYSYQLEWTEDSFISGEQNGETMRLTFNFDRLKLIGGFVLLMLCLILGRVFWLQIWQGDYYSAMAQGNRIRVKEIEPQRGIIYDQNGKPLVRNVANFVLYFIPGDMPKEEEERNHLIKKIAEILEDDKATEKMNRELEEINIYSLEAYEPIMVADNIAYNKAMKLMLKTREMPGIVLTDKNQRKYLNQFVIEEEKQITEEGEIKTEKISQNFQVESLSHILGYIGKINPEELKNNSEGYSPIDYIGKTGVEYSWEDVLRGDKGKKRIEVDALGKEKRIISEEPARNGSNIFLSLDTDLQAQVEKIVEKSLTEKELEKASVVVMNPQNGRILSLLSLPSFDNNIFSRGLTSEEYEEISQSEDKSLFNRAIKGEYPSGSTIKPVIGVAALQERVISENTTINSVGGIRIGQWFFPDWKAGGHGRTDIRKAIAQSVNSFFYYIGGGYKDFTGLGLERILEYDKLFGLGEETGIDLPAEADGFLPSREWKEEKFEEPWYIGDTYHLSIGQGFLLVTPLQVANFTSVFANYGTLYKPQVVQAVSKPAGEKEEIKPEVIRQDFIDQYNLGVIRQGMRRTVAYGSARSLNDLPVEVAGKTGTAQWSHGKDPHAWFTCFAPYDNPEIVVTVLVEEGGEGTYTSVPITKKILKYYFDKEAEKE